MTLEHYNRYYCNGKNANIEQTEGSASKSRWAYYRYDVPENGYLFVQ